MKQKLLFLLLALFFFTFRVSAQESSNETWDNQIYLGNKVAFGKDKWRFSAELQTRLKNNFQNLDNWYVELVSNYLFSKHIEFVPDLRYSIKPTKTELRPGFGILYKIQTSSLQMVNQVKYQIDFGSNGLTGHAFREVLFTNYRFNEQLVGTLVSGFIYRWWPDWNGFQYIRVGPGVSYIFDEKHILNFSYFVGVENKRDYWLWAGIPMIQLVINLSNKDQYSFSPAYYFDF